MSERVSSLSKVTAYSMRHCDESGDKVQGIPLVVLSIGKNQNSCVDLLSSLYYLCLTDWPMPARARLIG